MEKFWRYGFQFAKEKTPKGYKLYAVTDSNKLQLLGTKSSIKEMDNLIKNVVFKTVYG